MSERSGLERFVSPTPEDIARRDAQILASWEQQEGRNIVTVCVRGVKQPVFTTPCGDVEVKIGDEEDWIIVTRIPGYGISTMRPTAHSRREDIAQFIAWLKQTHPGGAWDEMARGFCNEADEGRP